MGERDLPGREGTQRERKEGRRNDAEGKAENYTFCLLSYI